MMQAKNEGFKMDIVRIINTSKADKSGFQIVLAEVTGFHKFVTWLRDAEGNYHHGDYCQSLKDAMESYFDRCTMNKIEA